ncbi:MAG TPA: class I SAM-dependent methyltransferase [Gemmatimonadales bacterium]|nr:class I SAM-dependent methyltransferase [Gemmatimonadales bacterium]
MINCCTGACGAIATQFDMARAEGDLLKYRKGALNPTTRLLRDAVIRAGGGETLLDVGAGIGTATFELLAGGFSTATSVDASPAFVAVERREAHSRGLASRMTIIEGDFVEAGDSLPTADVVIMDRVVCCYPEYAPLLEQALKHSDHLFAYAYPRDRWYVRLAMAWENLARAIKRNPFRAFVHSARAMEDIIHARRFRRVSRTETLVWCVDVYGRESA